MCTLTGVSWAYLTIVLKMVTLVYHKRAVPPPHILKVYFHVGGEKLAGLWGDLES